MPVAKTKANSKAVSVVVSPITEVQTQVQDYDLRIFLSVGIHITDETIGEAVEFQSNLNTLLTRVSKLEKEAVEPLKKELAEKTAPYLAMRKKITSLKELIAQKMSAYYLRKREEEERQKEAERKKLVDDLKKQQTKYEKKGDIDSSFAIAGAIEKVKADPIQIENRIATEAASVTFQDRFKYRVENLALVPEEWFKRVLDEDKITAAINSGTKEIPGLDIYNDPVVVTHKLGSRKVA